MHAEGSVLIEVGHTRVICNASIEDKVPPFLRNTGKGWVTAEYGMLPRATSTRSGREAASGKVGGRTMEIQRLIGRSMRSVVKLEQLGERTIWLDCDVIQADGGTRCASITGAFVALVLALGKLKQADQLKTIPISDYVAATSVGIVGGMPLLDLAYEEDSKADVDMNIVKTERRPVHRDPGHRGGRAVRHRHAARPAGAGRQGHYGSDRQAARDRRADPRPMTPFAPPSESRGLGDRPSHRDDQSEQDSRNSSAAGRTCRSTLITLADVAPVQEPEENGATFWENARIKALAYAARDRTHRRCRRFRPRDRRARRRARRSFGAVSWRVHALSRSLSRRFFGASAAGRARRDS